jgi:hypothetical protein
MKRSRKHQALFIVVLIISIISIVLFALSPLFTAQQFVSQ